MGWYVVGDCFKRVFSVEFGSIWGSVLGSIFEQILFIGVGFGGDLRADFVHWGGVRGAILETPDDTPSVLPLTIF